MSGGQGPQAAESGRHGRGARPARAAGRWSTSVASSAAAAPKARANSAPARRGVAAHIPRGDEAAAGAGEGRGQQEAVTADQEAKGVGQQHHLPVPHNRLLGARLVVRPAQLVLDGSVEVFDPVAHAVVGALQ